MKTEEPDVAQAFITKRRRAYPSLYHTDEDVLLWILGSSDWDLRWDDDGNIVEIRGTPESELKESFTEEGWKYMENAMYGRMRTSWDDPHDTSPFVRIPDNISDAWADKLRHLCYCIAKINEDDMRNWIILHLRFGGTIATHQHSAAERDFGAFLKVKQALALADQRLKDIQMAKRADALAKQTPRAVVPGVTVHHKGFASTDTAVVTRTASMPSGGDWSYTTVAILNRPLQGCLVVPVADLIPLTHPSTLPPPEQPDEDLASLRSGIITCSTYPRGSMAQERCLEEVAGDARYTLEHIGERPEHPVSSKAVVLCSRILSLFVAGAPGSDARLAALDKLVAELKENPPSTTTPL